MSRIVAGTLHEKVRQEVMRRVITNEYRAGERLPSAPELAKEFGVSLITMTRALRDLKTTGILRSSPGLGAFVRDTFRFTGDLHFSFTSLRDAEKQGLKLSAHLVSMTRERINDAAFSELDTPAGTLNCIRTTISVGGIPIALKTLFLPLSLDDKVVDKCASAFINEALSSRRMRFHRTVQLIDAAPASEEAQQAFGIPSGYPTLRRFSYLRSIDISLPIFGVAESPFDRLAWTVGSFVECGAFQRDHGDPY